MSSDGSTNFIIIDISNLEQPFSAPNSEEHDVQFNVAGFNPKQKLIAEAKEVHRSPDDDIIIQVVSKLQ
jgi:hypothetical protein